MNRRFLVFLTCIAIGGVAFTWVVRRLVAPGEVVVAPVSAPAPAGTAPAPAPPPSVARPAAAPVRRAAPTPDAPPAAPAEAAPTTATLHIDSDVPGAQVFVDRQFVGQAPATAPDLTPGPHVVNVSAQGYEGVSTTVTVEAGTRDLVVKLREVRLDVKLRVVHKHRLGSCTGQLIASPNGLRYDTTDKDDAFTAALLELQTFEVDYLEKNLRIQLQKGKRYDFTDPEGNADRLFVFHRDVEKARERLKKGDRPTVP